MVGGKIAKTALLLLCFSFTILKGDFIQKWYMPQGVNGFGNSVIQVVDTDRDGNIEFIFTTYGGSYTIYFYELHLPDTWEVDSASDLNAPLLWDSGDFDSDGFYDLVMQCGSVAPFWTGITVFESPDSFSYPTEEVWRDTVGQAAVQPVSVYDIDQDSIPEFITNNGAPPNWLWIYESTGNNQYDTVFTSNPDTSGSDGPVSTHGFGDFDQDGKIEFVIGGMSAGALGATYWIYESPENNSYEQTVQDYLPTKNIKDCFSVADADGDGKMEFVVKGFVIPSAEIHVFIFEATGDNTYEIIDTLVLPGGDYYGGYSAAGDVDGDSIPEIVLEARQNVFIIKAGANDSFYVWDTLPGHASGSSVAVYDVDGNGYAEVIVSGNDETRIYEYDPGGISEHGVREAAEFITVYPNPFSKELHIEFDAVFGQDELVVRIYDVTGRFVKYIYRGSTGSVHDFIWSGDNECGREVAAGVYYLVVTNAKSGFIATRKTLKLK